MIRLRGNKGEWSELYTLFRLLAEGRIYGADSELNRIDDIYYDILKVLRKQNDDVWTYNRNGKIRVISENTGQEVICIDINEFKQKADELLEDILCIREKKGAFELPDIWCFAEKIKCNTLKAPASDKSDIVLMVHDVKTGSRPTLGFSIKSRLGNPSTLLNAGKSTNFIFKLTGNVTDENMNEFNVIFNNRGKKDFVGRFKYLEEQSIDIEYTNMESQKFKNNLILIDSHLPDICGLMLKVFYTERKRIVKDILDVIEEENSIGYDQSDNHKFYTYKVKKLAAESALGMTPQKVWTGIAHATGGYIIVKEDGDIVCYHLYNRNEFEDYLINNLCLETASTSKYQYGEVYKSNNEYFLKLNLQLRFIK